MVKPSSHGNIFNSNIIDISVWTKEVDELTD